MSVDVLLRVALGALFLVPTACAPSWTGDTSGQKSDDAGKNDQSSEPEGGSDSGPRTDGSVESPADEDPTAPAASVDDDQPLPGRDASMSANIPTTDSGGPPVRQPDSAVPGFDSSIPGGDPPPTPPPSPSEEELCKICDEHATCTLVNEQAQCKCDLNYLGNGETCRFDANCSSLQCSSNSQCVADEAAGSLSCECKDGYSKSSNSAACSDIDECASPINPCKSADKPRCLNTAGSFECSCTPVADSPNIVQNGDFTLPNIAPWGARMGASTVSWELPGRAKLEAVGDFVYNDLLQSVNVEAGATYRLTAIASSDSNGGAFPCSYGLRLANSNENSISAEFPSGSQNRKLQADGVAALSALQIYIGCWSNADKVSSTFLRVDDVKLVKITGTGICK